MEKRINKVNKLGAILKLAGMSTVICKEKESETNRTKKQ